MYSPVIDPQTMMVSLHLADYLGGRFDIGKTTWQYFAIV